MFAVVILAVIGTASALVIFNAIINGPTRLLLAPLPI